jgi:hypothetical protein
LVFVSGAAVGAFSLHLYNAHSVSARTSRPRNPDEYRKRYTGEMKTRLGLNAEQTAKLNSILDETRNKFDELRDRSKPEMDAIHKDQIDRINGILTEPQRIEYEKLRKERDQNRQKNRQPPGF